VIFIYPAEVLAKLTNFGFRPLINLSTQCPARIAAQSAAGVSSTFLGVNSFVDQIID
jgi:hypothetical protein